METNQPDLGKRGHGCTKPARRHARASSAQVFGGGWHNSTFGRMDITPLMRTFLIASVLCFVSARGSEKAFEFNVTFKEVKEPKEIIGKWSFSGAWMGYMGMAIEFEEKEFRYWFRSDVKLPNPPKYPISGTWEVVKGVVVLKPTGGVHLYSEEWVMTKFGKSVGLTAVGDTKVLIWQQSTPETRMLTKVLGKPPVWPMFNTPIEIK